MIIFTRAMPPAKQLNLLYLADLAALWGPLYFRITYTAAGMLSGYTEPSRKEQSELYADPAIT